LRKLGLKGDVVADGREVLEALRSIPYDLVLMDVQMPEMNGLEATRAIRATSDGSLHRAIPIIAMTAHAMQGDREECLNAGMNDYIMKRCPPRLWRMCWKNGYQRKRRPQQNKPPECLKKTAAVSAKEPQTPVFDRAGMMARLMDDEDLARTVTKSFLEDIPRQIDALGGT